MEAKHRRHLYIVGNTGAGKSTVGGMAARLLGMPFIDVDEVIVSQQGARIPQIFQARGELAFRRCEQQALRSVAQTRPAVVATGGGILTFAGNEEIMRASGVILYLDRPLEDIVRDIDMTSRPMLKGGELRMRALYEARRPQYARASFAAVKNDADMAQAAARMAALYRAYTKNIKGEEEICASW
nr:shikimate kinase [Maliibacterium massiliense]